MIDMQPQAGQNSIQIPITFDYKGGRGENNKKNNIIIAVVFALLAILAVVTLVVARIEWWQKVLYVLVALYIVLWLARIVGFNELYFSDIFETLKERNFNLYTEDMWRIFSIEPTYPYVCYFKNGYKGIFVTMERDAITGKPDTAVYDHYEAISNAYNLAHSLNMDVVHVDYMDTVGNDERLVRMQKDVNQIANPKMKDRLQSMFIHLEKEMGRSYAEHDIYLYLTKEDKYNFYYNVQNVSSVMLGGNFITYTIMDREELNIMVKGLWNIHDFSILKACHNLIEEDVIGDIKVISVKHGDGTVDKINSTAAEIELEFELQQRKAQEEYEEKVTKRHKARREARERKKNKKKGNQVVTPTQSQGDDIDNLDLF